MRRFWGAVAAAGLLVAGCSSSDEATVSVREATSPTGAADVPSPEPTPLTSTVAGDDPTTEPDKQFVGGDEFGLSVVWERQLGVEAGRPSEIGVDTTDDMLVVGTAAGLVLAMRTADGEPLWERDLSADFEPDFWPAVGFYPVIDGEAVYVASTAGRLYALDLASGETRWEASIDGLPSGFPVVVDGVVAVGRAFRDLLDFASDAEYATTTARKRGAIAFDSVTGDVLWQLAADGLNDAYVTAGPGTVHVIVHDDGDLDDQSHVVTVDAATADERWRHQGRFAPPGTYRGPGYLVGYDGSSFLALAAGTGELVWSRPDLDTSPTLAGPLDDTIVVALEFDFVGLDAKTGDTGWVVGKGESDPFVYDGPPGLVATAPAVVWAELADGTVVARLADQGVLTVHSTAHGEVAAFYDGRLMLVRLER